MSEQLALAEQVVSRALALGASEATVTVSEGSNATILRRGGKVEQASQSRSRGLAISLMADGRWSSHSTSDLRTDALDTFLHRAVAATTYLEEDPDRALPEAELCGRGVSEAQMDAWDPAFSDWTPEARANKAIEMEKALDAVAPANHISSAVYMADGSSSSARVMSNGFADESSGAWFATGGEMTISDAGGRRPESAAYYGGRYLSDLPQSDSIAEEIARRAQERIGSGPIASGKYTMVLANKAAGRILGTLGGPISGGSLHQKQSCLEGKLGQRIGSPLFTILDDPTIPRGLGSRPWDGDGLVATPRAIVSDGVLQSYYISVYYGRKLKMEPTTGSRSNWVIPAGDVPLDDLLATLPKAILVDGFLGGNSNGTTGDFSFGIRGQLLEHGQPVKSLSEMNVSGNVRTIFDQLSAVGDDVWTYSSVRSPTLIFDDVTFSGT